MHRIFLFGKPDSQAKVLLDYAVNGHAPSSLEVLEMYANRRNWRKVAADYCMMWVWCGPIMAAPEAAERCLEEGDKEFQKIQILLEGANAKRSVLSKPNPPITKMFCQKCKRGIRECIVLDPYKRGFICRKCKPL